MKTQKAYTDRSQIVSEIEKKKRKKITCLTEADRLDAQADIFYKSNDAELHIQAGCDRDKAKKLRRSAFLLEEKGIPRLVRTLSAFDTVPLGMSGYEERRVVLEKS